MQVERIVGPILGLFLPDVIGPLIGDAPGDTGFEVVSPEFPLKRADNNQSTNIDWLLIDRRGGLVVLFELKTATDSIDRNQLDIYEQVRQRVERETASFLMSDVRLIQGASSQRAKYDALLDACANYEDALRAARRAATLCLVPAGSRLPDNGAPRIVRHFRDLPASIEGELAEDWVQVREALCSLEHPPVVASASLSRAPTSDADFARHVLANLQRRGEARMPVQFWIGDTGSGVAPNYQVEFGDGSVQTYHHHGATHGAPSFSPTRLRGPFAFVQR